MYSAPYEIAILIRVRMWPLVKGVPSHLNFVTLSNDLIPIIKLWFCPVCCSRNTNFLIFLSTHLKTCLPTSDYSRMRVFLYCVYVYIINTNQTLMCTVQTQPRPVCLNFPNGILSSKVETCSSSETRKQALRIQVQARGVTVKPVKFL